MLKSSGYMNQIGLIPGYCSLEDNKALLDQAGLV